MMKRSILLFLAVIFLVSVSGLAQVNKPTPKTSKTSLAKPKATPAPKNEKDELDKALAITDLAERIKALQQFTADFPASAEKIHVLEKIVSTRAQLADEKLQYSDTENGIQLFKDAVYDAPTPISESLFADVVLQFPTNLFYHGQQAAALEVAKLIEAKIGDNPKQLLGLATFYLGTEKADDAKRLAEKVIALNETQAADTQQKVSAYQTLGLANRLNFQLDESADAYAKALEINPDSAVSKRSLAEMKRALGKSDEAVTLYRELVEKDASDVSSQNGLILSLFDAGKQKEAEDALNKSLTANPNNLFLLVGASYWYAAHKNGEKAVDLAQKAVDLEPRYTWAHIALARGLMLQNKPLDAEKTLLLARQYGKFPTLSYELASVRLSSGFFEEAAHEVWKIFVVKADGTISTTLAGRTQKEDKDFIKLLDLERRASIFEPTTADNPENAERIKNLLYFYQMLDSKEATEDQVNKSVDAFVKGDDNMRTHRQIYAANQLLLEKKDLSKVLELTQTAVKGVDSSLDVPNVSSAVLADELLESRVLAISRNEVVVVPDIPHQTLSYILRGRIEDISGWALFQQGKIPEAVVRLKRAVSILPEKSAWWRASLWRLGLAYDANGNSKDSLDAYVKSYNNSQPDSIKWSTIETVYRKVNGNADGLDKLIGVKPYTPETVAQTIPSPEPTPAVTPTADATPQVSPTPLETPVVQTSPTPSVTEMPTVSPTPTPQIEAATTPVVTKKVEPTPEIKPEISPGPTPQSTPEAIPTATPEVKTEPTPNVAITPTPTPTVASAVKNDNQTAENKSEIAKTTPVKPLFDPIIITVPKPETVKPANTDKPSEKPTEKPSENDEKSAENKDKPAEKSDKPSEDTTSALGRQRVIKENKTAETPAGDTAPCLVASQDSISILNKGGNLGILIGYSNDDGDISKIKVESSSPDDVAVSLEPDIGRQSNRLFFIIKSISEKKGIFNITFTSPCGKKEILVKVR